MPVMLQRALKVPAPRLADGAWTDDASVLLVDLGNGSATDLSASLAGLPLLIATDRDETIALLRRHKPWVAVIGLGPAVKANGASPGLALLSRILAAEPTTKVVATTSARDRELAIDVIGRGAWDVLEPPLAPEMIRFAVERAVAVTGMEQEHRQRQMALCSGLMPGILGESPAMITLCRQLLRVAPTDASVVLTGESGTGKEISARAMHAASPRRDRRFMAINCAAIPETLLESELFGHERGAFTGAIKLTPGRIEMASGGTLFLDEIGDLPLSLQGKLLRFLQERVVERVGGRREIAVDVRIICATHRDLAGLMAAGSFREDLYYRLNEIAIHLPPLRERDGDAILMAHHFLDQYGGSAAPPLKGYGSAALLALDAHLWPGNVRELQNRVKRAVIMAAGPRIEPADLNLPDVDGHVRDLDLRRCRDEVEQSVLRRALARCNGNLASTARLIGVSRPTLYDLLRQHGLRG